MIKTREPWQMTKADWGQVFEHPGYGGRMMVSITGPAYSCRIRQTTEHFRTRKSAEKWIRDEHKRSIKQALIKGKPIPAEVLADYPDLN